jgi:hypothetical protein
LTTAARIKEQDIALSSLDERAALVQATMCFKELASELHQAASAEGVAHPAVRNTCISVAERELLRIRRSKALRANGAANDVENEAIDRLIENLDEEVAAWEGNGSGISSGEDGGGRKPDPSTGRVPTEAM